MLEKPSEAFALLVDVHPVLYALEPAAVTGFRVVLERCVITFPIRCRLTVEFGRR